MLAGVRPGSLARLRFPLAELDQARGARDRRRRAGLPVARKPESQDLCFLAGEGKRAFLARHGGLADAAGEPSDRAGRVLGRHRGHHHFTVGQRRGLGVAAAEPLYVLATDADLEPRRRRHARGAGRRARVAVATRSCTATARASTGCKLRYRSRPLACRVEGGRRRTEVGSRLAEPAYGVAPGQTACLLDGDRVVGHGTIA